MAKKSTDKMLSSPGSPMFENSNPFAALDTPMMWKQAAGKLGTPLEEWKPMTKSKKSRKRKSSLRASAGATTSSSAPVSSSASASDLQAEVLVENVNPFDSSDDLDATSHHAATDVATDIDQESFDTALSQSGGNSKREEARINKYERLPDDGEIIPEFLGSKSNFSKNFRQERPGNLKVVNKDDDNHSAFVARDVFSNYRKTDEGRSSDACIKEKLKTSRAAKNEKLDTMIGSISFSRMFTLIYFIATNTSLKAEFAGPKWPKMYKLPKFDSSADHDWWYQNFDLEIAVKRLKIMKEASNVAYPDLKYYELCQANSETNAHAHPRADLEVVIKMAEQKQFVFGVEDLARPLVHCARVVERTGSKRYELIDKNRIRKIEQQDACRTLCRNKKI